MKTTNRLNSQKIKSTFFKPKLSAAILFFLLMGTALLSFSQTAKSKKASISVLHIDTKGLNMDAAQMGDMVRIELEKLDSFDVMDRYDVSYVIEKNKLNINNCYGKICLVEVGSSINSDKMFTGSVELIGETIYCTFRIIDIKTASIEKTQVNEYLNLPKEIQSMVKITMLQLFHKPVEEPLIAYLTKKNNFESSTNNANKTSVNLSGPRTGFSVFTGEASRVLQDPRNKGGYNSYPVLFQFGYQFEVQYLNEGHYQALFEFIPTITGFNQNIFIPSISIMNGFRNNKNGWEIAFGPTLGVVNKTDGYYDTENVWHMRKDWISKDPIPYNVETRLDSRGDAVFQAGFIIAVGKTFKSGKLNIPVNLYLVPNKEGIRGGLSFGFNAKKNKTI